MLWLSYDGWFFVCQDCQYKNHGALRATVDMLLDLRYGGRVDTVDKVMAAALLDLPLPQNGRVAGSSGGC